MPNGTNQNKKYSNRTRPIEYKFRVTQEEYDELSQPKFKGAYDEVKKFCPGVALAMTSS